jgi:hypothetical protein
LHPVFADSCVSAASASLSVFDGYQARFELPLCGLQVVSSYFTVLSLNFYLGVELPAKFLCLLFDHRFDSLRLFV